MFSLNFVQRWKKYIERGKIAIQILKRSQEQCVICFVQKRHMTEYSLMKYLYYNLNLEKKITIIRKKFLHTLRSKRKKKTFSDE